MGGWKRDLLTFISGFFVLAILLIISVIIASIASFILLALSIPVEDNPIALMIISFICFIFVTIPYCLLTTYFIYKTIIPLNTKKYGILGGPGTSGALCWLFSNWTLPYVLFAKIWPVEYVVEEQPLPNRKRNFYIGWGIAFVISLLFLFKP